MTGNKYLQIRRIWKQLLELEKLADETNADEDVLEAIFLIRQGVFQLANDILDDMTVEQLEQIRAKEFGV